MLGKTEWNQTSHPQRYFFSLILGEQFLQIPHGCNHQWGTMPNMPEFSGPKTWGETEASLQGRIEFSPPKPSVSPSEPKWCVCPRQTSFTTSKGKGSRQSIRNYLLLKPLTKDWALWQLGSTYDLAKWILDNSTIAFEASEWPHLCEIIFTPWFFALQMARLHH